MKLSAFSISLTIKDATASIAFHPNLGFVIVGSDTKQNWLILDSDDCNIGLFQGMFGGNMLTVNSGWRQQEKPALFNQHL